MLVTVVFTSKALPKASPRPSFDGQQQKSGLFHWGGGLETLPFGQQTYGLFCDSESGRVFRKSLQQFLGML